MNNIEKAAQYRSFYDVAKKITTPESRLAFYEALDAYRFDGLLPDALPVEADIAFTAIKPIIDADIGRKQGGAPKGNSNARKAIKEEPHKEEAPDTKGEEATAGQGAEPETKKKRFEKPTVPEISRYCSERGNTISAENFYNFYESKGWRIGSTPMKDWKAAVRTWEQRANTPKQPIRELPDERMTF